MVSSILIQVRFNEQQDLSLESAKEKCPAPTGYRHIRRASVITKPNFLANFLSSKSPVLKFNKDESYGEEFVLFTRYAQGTSVKSRNPT